MYFQCLACCSSELHYGASARSSQQPEVPNAKILPVKSPTFRVQPQLVDTCKSQRVRWVNNLGFVDNDGDAIGSDVVMAKVKLWRHVEID